MTGVATCVPREPQLLLVVDVLPKCMSSFRLKGHLQKIGCLYETLMDVRQAGRLGAGLVCLVA